MRTIATTLIHRVLPPAHPSARSSPLLIMLHGRGADEEDLLGLVHAFDDRLLVVSARAPYPFTASGGYTWYDVGAAGNPDPAMFSASYGKLVTFVQDLRSNYPVDPDRVFLFGFSMGTVMAFALALTLPHLVRGVLANSGYIPEETAMTFRWDAVGRTDFFVAHGVHDPIIPVQLARRACELLSQHNASIHYQEYPFGHQIGEESIADAAAWLLERLETTPG